MIVPSHAAVSAITTPSTAHRIHSTVPSSWNHARHPSRTNPPQAKSKSAARRGYVRSTAIADKGGRNEKRNRFFELHPDHASPWTIPISSHSDVSRSYRSAHPYDHVGLDEGPAADRAAISNTLWPVHAVSHDPSSPAPTSVPCPQLSSTGIHSIHRGSGY